MISNFFESVNCANNNDLSGDVGAAQFKAPEVATESYGKSCDIFSLGCTIYYLYYGESPIGNSEFCMNNSYFHVFSMTDPITEQISYKLLDRVNKVSPLGMQILLAKMLRFGF